MSATSASLSAEDEELIMIVKLRRLFPSSNQGDSEKMKELKLRLRNDLPHEIRQPGIEFQDVFDTLKLKNKIVLGEYRFLCEVFFDIYMEAQKITEEHQSKIRHLLELQVSEQKSDSLVDKKEIVSTLMNTKIDYSNIVTAAVNRCMRELDEGIECRKNVSKMAQVAVQANQLE